MILDRPVFIVGCGRSGTTVLRLMLNRHSALAIPGETWYFHKLYRHWKYRKLFGAAAARKYIKAAIAGYETFADLGIDHADLDLALARIDPLDPSQAVAAGNIAFMLKEGKGRWGDKTPGYVCRLQTIKRLWPDAHILHIIRDGRDVALSFLQVPFGPATLPQAARHWRERVACGRSAGPRLFGDRYLEVKYEALVQQPAGELRRICAAIGLPFEETMLSADEAGPSYIGEGQYWLENATREIRADRVARWRKELSPQDRLLFWHQAGELLAALGYPGPR